MLEGAGACAKKLVRSWRSSKLKVYKERRSWVPSIRHVFYRVFGSAPSRGKPPTRHKTIAPGDRCWVVPIVSQKTHRKVEFEFEGEKYAEFGMMNSVCYPTRFWAPVGGFLEAVYADYGGVKLEKTRGNFHALMLFLGAALERMPVISEGENKYHDLGLDLNAFMREHTPILWGFFKGGAQEKTPDWRQHVLRIFEQESVSQEWELLFEQAVLCWDAVFRVVRKHRGFWFEAGSSSTPRSVDFAVCHGVALEALVSRAVENKEPGDSMGFCSSEVEQELRAIDTESPVGVNVGQRLMLVQAFLRKVLAEIGLEGRYSDVLEIFRILTFGLTTGAVGMEVIEQVLSAGRREGLVRAGMLELNLHFEPMVYASRGYYNEEGQAYARFVAEVSREVSKGRGNEEG